MKCFNSKFPQFLLSSVHIIYFIAKLYQLFLFKKEFQNNLT